MDGNLVVFFVLAVFAVGSALAMLLSRSAVNAALWLVLNFVTVAVYYLLMGAPFIALAQIAIYAGAIMVLFLFVIMMLGNEKLPSEGRRRVDPWVGAIFGLALAVELGIFVIARSGVAGVSLGNPTFDASPFALGTQLFNQYAFPFEIASVILLVAAIGVVVLGKRERPSSGGSETGERRQ